MSTASNRHYSVFGDAKHVVVAIVKAIGNLVVSIKNGPDRAIFIGAFRCKSIFGALEQLLKFVPVLLQKFLLGGSWLYSQLYH